MLNFPRVEICSSKIDNHRGKNTHTHKKQNINFAKIEEKNAKKGKKKLV